MADLCWTEPGDRVVAVSLWATRANEVVGTGDVVALNVLAHADAVGRTAAKTDLGLIRCVMLRGNIVKPSEFMEVEEDQLSCSGLPLVRQAGSSLSCRDA